MRELNADANKIDVHSKSTLKQLLFKIYTKEKSMHFCVQFGGAWASYRVAHSLS